jgi:riboflavin synthase
MGESVAVNGACLTVTGKGILSSGKMYFTADLSAETIYRTVPGQWQKERKVNLERALKANDALDGHIVTGHIDGAAAIKNILSSDSSYEMELEVPVALSRFIAEKGSVTLDGVSLTVNKVEGRRFWVNIIPHTRQATTLGERRGGDALNLEIDLIARYVARLMAGNG